MVFSTPLRILLLCLLHFSTRAVGQDVNPNILQRIITRFHRNLGLGQYAVVFRVDMNTCLYPSNFPDRDLLAQVRDTIQNNGVYDGDNLVAAKAYLNQHSEYRLRNRLGNILNVPNQCVIYFTVNSPCLATCLSDGSYNIKSNLRRLRNYAGIKALAFRLIWRHDNEQALRNRLNFIAPRLPTYHCVRNMPTCDPF